MLTPRYSHGTEIKVLTVCIKSDYELGDQRLSHPRNFFERLPKLIFKAHARSMSANAYRYEPVILRADACGSPLRLPGRLPLPPPKTGPRRRLSNRHCVGGSRSNLMY